MILSGAQILIKELIRNGVTDVFGYPGGAVLNIYDELYKSREEINHIITAHEQGASHAADGYARATGKTGVVIATSGPGATNLVTGIATAYLDSVPLVAITGNVSVPLLGRDSFQEVDIVGITLPIVKHSFVVREVEKLEEVINKAFKIANEGRKGPVIIDIPKDVQVATTEYGGNIRYPSVSIGSCIESDFIEAVRAINDSKRPYIYCGGGVLSAKAEGELKRLSDKISAPIGLSMMGLAAVDGDNPMNLGMCGMHGKYAASAARARADLVIATGVRFSDRATGDTQKYAENCRIIHIDIDEAELGKNINSHINLCGDVKYYLQKLYEQTDKKDGEEWLREVDGLKSACNLIKRDREEFSPGNIIETVNSFCSEDTVVATDVGQHQMWTMQYYKFRRPNTLLTSGGLGTMGYGLGAAIGGCIGKGRERTVLFTSDGSFGMNLNELATAVSQQLPVVIVLLNNGVLGMVRQWQTMFYGERYSQTTLERKTDFPALARSFGAEGFTAKTLEQLREILEKLPSNRPVLIDCHIGKDEMVLPMIPPGGTIDDIIVERK